MIDIIKNYFAKIFCTKNVTKSSHLNEDYRTLLENTSDVIWKTDLNLNITYISPSIFKLTGETPEEHIKKSLSNKFSEKDLKWLKELLQQGLAEENEKDVDKKRSIMFEIEQIIADGSTKWVEYHITFFRNEEGKPIGLIGVTRDISARKKLEETFKKTEEDLKQERYLLRTLVDNLPHVVYVIDKYGRKTFTNKADMDFFGRVESEAIHQTDMQINSPEQSNQYLLNNEKVLKEGQAIIDNVEKVQNAKGEWRWVLTSKIPLRDSNGEIIGLIGIGRDITEQKQAEEKIKEQLQELQQWHDITLNREERIISLKKEINQILKELGKPPRYLLNDKILLNTATMETKHD